MLLENEFKKPMSVLSDRELVEINYINRHKYQELALEAAKRELEERDLSKKQIKDIIKQIEDGLIDQFVVNFDTVGSDIRLINFLIDLILWSIIYGISVFLLGFIVPYINYIVSDTVKHVVYVITFFGYYGLMEFKYQRTLAKFITKTWVVTLNGLKPSGREILIRTLSRLIPMDPVSYLFTPFGIHDKLSKTRVVGNRLDEIIH